jgi:hypothetical protein
MTVVSMRQAALRAGDFGERQDQIDDLDARRTLAPDSISAKTGEPYAEIIRRHGIVKFEFSYATGAFHALDAAGEALASGETIRELLDSL